VQSDNTQGSSTDQGIAFALSDGMDRVHRGRRPAVLAVWPPCARSLVSFVTTLFPYQLLGSWTTFFLGLLLGPAQRPSASHLWEREKTRETENGTWEMQHYSHIREAPRWGESDNPKARKKLRQIADQMQQREFRYQQQQRFEISL